ncbi:hypothetical protein HPB48_011818 [Haemaphysalis longicornis]|uniref:Uncharacterized protein n=1 Tax=Haemaphysalis longicornis TaxID=44386 RepID=A0A9J6GJ94_HAELO|nr:hypothetical protein HPB48_011818 [Haemaphysalis longicornis]
MDDGASPFDMGYLAGAFEPSRLQQLSSRLSDVLRNAKVDVAASGAMLPARGSNCDDMIEACNAVLDPIGIELRELEPRRFGLRTPQIEGDDEVNVKSATTPRITGRSPPGILVTAVRACRVTPHPNPEQPASVLRRCPQGHSAILLQETTGPEVERVLRKLKLNGLEAESSECMARVFEAVKVNATLESFAIGIVDPVSEENGGELALSSLLEAIEANKALRSLCLQGGILSNKTLRRIAKSLTANPTLKILRIFPPSLEDKEDTEGFWEDVRDSCDRLDVQWWNSAGLNQLALALPQSKVDKLFLNWTFGMWNAPLVEVMRGLQANQTITRLHLHNIDCYDDADMEALAEYVSKTKVLKKLTMIYEILHPEAGIPLIDALAENTSINCVDFGKFDMNLEACKHFGAMLAKNRTRSTGYDRVKSTPVQTH